MGLSRAAVLAIAGQDTLVRSELQIELATQGGYEVTPENIQPLLETWADGALLEQEARRRGFGDDETTGTVLADARRNYLVGLMTRRLTDTVAATENQVFDYYNRRKLDFVTQIRFQYMILPDEKTARSTVNELKRPGAQFKVLAQERSLDRASNPSAELTLVGRNDSLSNLDPLLEDTLFTLPMGKTSPPLKFQGQYWLVEVTERIRLRDTLPLNVVQTFIREFLELKRKRAVLERAVRDLKSRTRVSLVPSKGDTTGFLAQVADNILTQRRLQLQLGADKTVRPEDVNRLVEVWVNSELLQREAERLGVGSDDTTRVLLRARTREYVANLLVDRLTASVSVASNEAFDYFQKYREDFLDDVRILYCLSGSDSAAREVLAEAKQGADFQKLVRERSIDRAITQGAESRYLSRLDRQTELTPLLEETIFSLPVGAIGPVLHTSRGYWVVKVTDRKRVRNDVSFEQAGKQITAFLYRKRCRELVDELLSMVKQSNPPEFFPSNFWQ